MPRQARLDALPHFVRNLRPRSPSGTFSRHAAPRHPPEMDERILGSGPFVAWMLAADEARPQTQLARGHRLRLAQALIRQLRAEELCGYYLVMGTRCIICHISLRASSGMLPVGPQGAGARARPGGRGVGRPGRPRTHRRTERGQATPPRARVPLVPSCKTRPTAPDIRSVRR